jgi:hypothetical protein
MYLGEPIILVDDILLFILLEEPWVLFDVISFSSINSFDGPSEYGGLVSSQVQHQCIFLFAIN